MLTQEYLKECLNYNPETGVFTWEERPVEHFKSESAYKTWNIRFSNKIAGSVNGSGYTIITISGSVYQSHRLAWLYVYGKFPKLFIDHKDGDRLNNRIKNLRDVSNQVNCQNTLKAYENNKLGIRGVRKTRGGKYESRILVNGKSEYLGSFETKKQAHAAYLEAKKIHHKGYIHD